MKINRRRRIIRTFNLLDQPIRFNPFVFSRTFFMWAIKGLVGGTIAGCYWIILEHFTELAIY